MNFVAFDEEYERAFFEDGRSKEDSMHVSSLPDEVYVDDNDLAQGDAKMNIACHETPTIHRVEDDNNGNKCTRVRFHDTTSKDTPPLDAFLPEKPSTQRRY